MAINQQITLIRSGCFLKYSSGFNQHMYLPIDNINLKLIVV